MILIKSMMKKGNPVYNYVNPVFNDMNTLAFSKMDIYNTKTHRALISPFIDLNIFGVHWRNSFSYDYTNMDEMRWYNPEHGNGAAVDGRLSKYAISDITSTFTSTLNYAFLCLMIIILVCWPVMKHIRTLIPCFMPMHSWF